MFARLAPPPQKRVALENGTGPKGRVLGDPKNEHLHLNGRFVAGKSGGSHGQRVGIGMFIVPSVTPGPPDSGIVQTAGSSSTNSLPMSCAGRTVTSPP